MEKSSQGLQRERARESVESVEEERGKPAAMMALRSGGVRRAIASRARTFASSDDDRKPDHWLSRSFPKQEAWLLEQAEQWWYKGLSALLKSEGQSSLATNHDLILTQVRDRNTSLQRENRERIVDGRSRTHLQQACLALATYEKLSPWVGDKQESLLMVSRLLGKDSASILNPLQRMSMWLTRNKFSMVAKRIKLLSLDYGSSFETSVEEEEGLECVLTVKSCFYDRFFREMEVPELTSATCCSVDALWFTSDAIRDDGSLEFSRPSSIAEGDDACVLRLVNRKGR